MEKVIKKYIVINNDDNYHGFRIGEIVTLVEGVVSDNVKSVFVNKIGLDQCLLPKHYRAISNKKKLWQSQ